MNLLNRSFTLTKVREIAFFVFVMVFLITGLFEPALPQSFSGSRIVLAINTGMTMQQEPIINKVFLPSLLVSSAYYGSGAEWSMVGANPQRTSWTPEQVHGDLIVDWYRPIEAYISQNVQIITSNGLLYISTAKGLYALNAANGELAWRYDTEMPMGNSPTVSDGVIYVGGYDRKIHALDAITGEHLWEYSGAQAGYDSNPLVVDGKVIVGNRDGYMYAIGAHNTTNQGQLIWKFKTGGPIHLSPAYKDGIVYFAANDNYAYAIHSSTGDLVWKSDKLPGDGYHSHWPVIYEDYVIFSASVSYRMGIDPGTKSIKKIDGSGWSTYRYLEVEDLFPGEPDGTLLGPTVEAQAWSHGYPVIDGSRVTEYFENNPNLDLYKYKPWRRTYIVLNINDGKESTFDSDQDGFQEYIPVTWWGTNSGNRYPPVVGADNTTYFNNLYIKTGDSQGKVMGWKFGTQYLSVMGGQAAIAEPQAISSGGSLIYRSLCCDRVGDYFDSYHDGIRNKTLWSYNLEGLAPGYDEMWTILPGWPRLQGWYKGNSESINGIYHNHGDQNPLIPYQGRLYIHRSNAIIAYGTGPARGMLSPIYINSVEDNMNSTSVNELQSRLEIEIQKILNAGHLRPGYYNNGQFTNYKELADYFENPGDTLYTLSIAYPHLPSQLQNQLKDYLRNEFFAYFDPIMYAKIGWAEGAPRESMPVPPEVESALAQFPKSEVASGWSWQYPQHNIYAMWKYAQIFPEDATRIYDLAKSKLQVPVPDYLPIPINEWFTERPYEVNAYMAGYIGFLRLQELAGKTGIDSQLRTAVTNELNRLVQFRADTFSKDTIWIDDYYHKRSLNIARNFMMLVPEVGEYLNQYAFDKVLEAINEYEYIAPYWFVSRYETMMNEGAMSPLYNYPSIFQAKAYILGESREDLVKFLDVPAFERGDLFYIQNLVATIEAPLSIEMLSSHIQEVQDDSLINYVCPSE